MHRIHHATGFRLLTSLIIGAAATLYFLQMPLGLVSFLLGWDCAVTFFILWTWLIIWPMGHDRTAAFARREDPSRVGADIIFALATIASLAAVCVALFFSHTTTNTDKALFLTIVSIVSV